MTETPDSIHAVEQVLTEYGPLREDDVAGRLRTAGITDTDIALRQIRMGIYCPAAQLTDDRWVWLPHVLAGRVFTHRISAAEVEHDILTATPDLSPVVTLCNYPQYQRLVDGSTAQLVLAGYDDELLDERDIPERLVDESGALLLDEDTLKPLGVADGDLVGVRLTEQGLAIERVAAVADAAAGAALAATLDTDKAELFDAAVWTACATDATLFTEPVAPLSEVAADCGLAHRGEWLAPTGFDFERWDFERACARLAERHDLDDDDAIVLQTLIGAYRQMSMALLLGRVDADGPLEGTLAGELGGALADPLLAQLLAAETAGDGRVLAPALGMLAELLEAKVPRPAQVACRWLRAVALERAGDIDAAERELLAAQSMDADFPLTLIDLARIASDRGDAEGGLALLHRAGAPPEHPLLQLLQRHRTEPRPDLGRNEPCWCGSGRKYKKCHLGHEQLALADRAGWLYAKAGQHALLGDWVELLDLLDEAIDERARYADPDDPDALEAALADPLAMDAVLFEGGAFDEFLAVRGSLLPDDERSMAEQWLRVDRSVFEVEQVRPGHGITVRDVRSGDTHEVRERTASRRLRSGQLICARVVPAGDTMQIVGGLEPVAPQQRGALIELLASEPAPAELVAALSPLADVISSGRLRPASVTGPAPRPSGPVHTDHEAGQVLRELRDTERY